MSRSERPLGCAVAVVAALVLLVMILGVLYGLWHPAWETFQHEVSMRR